MSISAIFSIPYERTERLGILQHDRKTQLRIQHTEHKRIMFRDICNNTHNTILVGHAEVLMYAISRTLVQGDVVLSLIDAVTDHMGNQIPVLMVNRILRMRTKILILLQL